MLVLVTFEIQLFIGLKFPKISSDYNSNKQLSTAIEVFWSQNKTIIESPSIHSGLSKHVNKLPDGNTLIFFTILIRHYIP
jgi:hypothetical protein